LLDNHFLAHSAGSRETGPGTVARPAGTGETPGMGVLDGKTALVTGGSGGIGRSAAAHLARDGALVTIAARDKGRLARSAAEVQEAAGPGAAPVRWTVCDAADAAAVRAAVEEAAEPGGEGRLDIAVSVPGGGVMAPIFLYDDERFLADVDFNIRAPWFIVKYAGSQMVRQGTGGAIVAVSSTAAVQPSPNLAAYCAGKAAVDMLVRVAADELGAAGVRVNAVRPGLTDTDGPGRMIENADTVAAYMAQQPIRRVGRPDDIGALIRHLCGPESSWITGQCIGADGGHTLRGFPDLDHLVRARWGNDAVDKARRGEIA
jgi:NAD(P)-dependent dehydrogenase (short-subunit alcohol dehydrogenase family)